MKKEVFLLEKINRYNQNGDTVVEISISKGSALWSEEYEEYENFERSDYISERFFKDGVEIDSDKWFDGMDEDYEEADWEEESILSSIEEAKKYEKEFIGEF